MSEETLAFWGVLIAPVVACAAAVAFGIAADWFASL